MQGMGSVLSKHSNPAASAFPVACRGECERMGNIIIPYGSKILRSLLRRASILGHLCVHIFGPICTSDFTVSAAPS